MKKPKICILLGTRPEIIKMSPIIRECERLSLDYFILHSGQHYSENMDKFFFDDLELPRPKYNLSVGSGNHGEQTGKILSETEKIFLSEKPDIVLVEGDTNTVLAGALSASKLHIKVGHVEAGLRSRDMTMPEEINRILADHCSDFLFAPTLESSDNLKKENLSNDKISIVGNTVVDAIKQNLDIAKKKKEVLEKYSLKQNSYFLLTLHRQENADNKTRLEDIFKGLEKVYSKYKLPIFYPIHPRTQKMIKTFDIKVPEGILLNEPIGYLDFLFLEENARLILTDSGGIQEESCILNIPCVTLRDNTERPETLRVNSNVLAGANPDKIFESVEKMMFSNKEWENPYGNGTTGKQIISLILDFFQNSK